MVERRCVFGHASGGDRERGNTSLLSFNRACSSKLIRSSDVRCFKLQSQLHAATRCGVSGISPSVLRQCTNLVVHLHADPSTATFCLHPAHTDTDCHPAPTFSTGAAVWAAVQVSTHHSRSYCCSTQWLCLQRVHGAQLRPSWVSQSTRTQSYVIHEAWAMHLEAWN